MRCPLMLAALAVAMAVPVGARAEDCSDASSRTLGGHRFMYPATIDSAFVQTYFGTRTTGRYETVPNLPIGSNLVSVNSLGIAENLDFALAIGDRWSVGLGLFGRTILGINGRALATTGAIYGYGANLDAAFRIARIEESGTQITARGELFGVQGGGQISLLPFIRSIREDPARDVPAALANFGDLLVTPLSQLGGAASINLAQAFGPVLSLQASFRVDVRRIKRSPFVPGQGRTEVTSTSWLPQGGVALGVNPVDWPVAFSAEYRLAAQAEDDPTAGGRHLMAVGAYYSARSDLQLGPVAAAELGLPVEHGVDANGNIAGSDRGNAFLGQLIMRYIW